MAVRSIWVGTTDGNTITAASGVISVIFGGDGKDVLTGDSGGDYLHGGDSGYNSLNVPLGDVLYGLGGDDVLCPSENSNHADDQTAYGGNGDDYIRGGLHEDILYGGDGNDVLQGAGNDDTCYGEDGNDYVGGRAIHGWVGEGWARTRSGDHQASGRAVGMGGHRPISNGNPGRAVGMGGRRPISNGNPGRTPGTAHHPSISNGNPDRTPGTGPPSRDLERESRPNSGDGSPSPVLERDLAERQYSGGHPPRTPSPGRRWSRRGRSPRPHGESRRVGGGSGDDVLYGDDLAGLKTGNDILHGGKGFDYFDAGDGDDTVFAQDNAEDDTIDGGNAGDGDDCFYDMDMGSPYDDPEPVECTLHERSACAGEYLYTAKVESGDVVLYHLDPESGDQVGTEYPRSISGVGGHPRVWIQP